MNPTTRAASRAARTVLAAAIACALAPAVAHEGHDHGDAPAAALPVPGGPRFVAVSDRFELVGAIDGRRLTVWLDGAGDNAPVVGARIELDIDGRTIEPKADGDVYVATLDAPPSPGRVPVTATIVAGDASDLLAGELAVDAPAGNVAAAASAPGGGLAGGDTVGGAWTTGAIAAASAGVGALLAWIAARRRPLARTER
jgi:hypothetical protein